VNMPTRINKSSARSMDILSHIAAKHDPVTITEISHALGIPKSSAFELLYTLIEKGYLEFADRNLKTFKLGIKVFQVGLAFLARTDVHREARPLLEALMASCKETAFLAVESNGQLVYLDKVEGTSSVRTSATLGSRNPMHCTGLGKALLAAYSDSKVEEIVRAAGMPSRTEYTITKLSALQRDLETTRQRGYAIDDRESEREVFCVAASISDMSGRPVAAISIASLASKMLGNPRRVAKFGNLIAETALSISRRIGFTGRRLYPQRTLEVARVASGVR